jgi:dienelactone hydrolase
VTRFSRVRSGLFLASLAIFAPSAGTLGAQATLSVAAPDGGFIAADLYGTGSRGVVLAHGGRFDKSSWREQALVLAQRGFRVLAIDFRAAAQSRAGTDTPCLYDPTCLAGDVLAAVRYLRRIGAQSVAVVGGSFGGGAAAQASVDAAPGEIDCVILLAHLPIDHPEAMKGRKLFIVSRDDVGSGEVPRLSGIREQYRKAPKPKQLVVLEGSAHAQFIFSTKQGPRLMAEILRFLSTP